MRQQQAYDLGMAVFGRQHQRGAAVFVAALDGDTLFEQFPDLPGLSLSGREQQVGSEIRSRDGLSHQHQTRENGMSRHYQCIAVGPARPFGLLITKSSGNIRRNTSDIARNVSTKAAMDACLCTIPQIEPYARCSAVVGSVP